MSETPEKPEAKTEPATKADLFRAFRLQDATLGLGIIGAILTAYIHLSSTARAESERGDAVEHAQMEARYSQAEARISAQNSRLDFVEQKQRNTDQEMFEMRKDLREFYRAWSDGRRSQRLEQPLTPPDGGN